MSLFLKDYTYLVSSLVEYSVDSDGKGLDVRALLEQMDESLDARDKRHVAKLLWRHDIENIMAAKAGRARYAVPANLSAEQVAEVCGYYFSSGKDGGAVAPEIQIPHYIERVLDSYRDQMRAMDEQIDTSADMEHTLWECYYAAAERSSSSFMRRWSRFDRQLRNIVAAFAARAKGIDISGVLVGHDEVTERLVADTSAGFGLAGSFDGSDELTAILESDDMLAKERRLDVFRWRKVDELTTFDYFNINFVLGYLVKVGIICRWMVLDRETGRQMLDRMIEQLTPAEVVRQAVMRG